nr:hypothetical protein [Micromonospora sp. DSM 115978]
MIDLDKPCLHPDFVAVVEVNRIAADASQPPTAYMADVRVRCAACEEPFRWTGLRAGLSYGRPMVSVDETELHAPLRPASADPDFGMGLPGFAITHRPGQVGGTR